MSFDAWVAKNYGPERFKEHPFATDIKLAWEAGESSCPKWIPVTESLPEIGEEVIVFRHGDRHRVTALVRLIAYEGARGFFWDNYYGGRFTHTQDAVTHWMRLPSPPCEERPE